MLDESITQLKRYNIKCFVKVFNWLYRYLINVKLLLWFNFEWNWKNCIHFARRPYILNKERLWAYLGICLNWNLTNSHTESISRYFTIECQAKHFLYQIVLMRLVYVLHSLKAKCQNSLVVYWWKKNNAFSFNAVILIQLT